MAKSRVSEALFTALAAWALHACLQRRWLLAGLLAALAGLTRPVGAAVVAAVLVTALVQVLRERGGRPPAGALLAPLGLLGYVGWVGLRVGDPAGSFRVARGWGNGFEGGRAFGGKRIFGDSKTWRGVASSHGCIRRSDS